MLRMKHVALPVALTLALALTGCGQSASNGSTDTAGQATTEAAAGDTTLEVPEDLAGAAEEMRSVDPEEVTDEAVAAEAPAGDSEDLVVDPGTQYTVRFGGNVYATPDQIDSNVIDYVYPDYVLNIDERLEDAWYAVTYWIDGAARSGYIKIQ